MIAINDTIIKGAQEPSASVALVALLIVQKKKLGLVNGLMEMEARRQRKGMMN